MRHQKQRYAVKAFVDERYGNKDCAMYSDMREFFEQRPDIDAVLIATGDRWHAQASIRAMRAGKDVYTEKPSTMTIAEGRLVVQTAAQYGRVYQTGTQRLSEPNHVFCIEMARTGRLGKVDTAYAHIAPWDTAKMPRTWKEAQPEPPKDVVDWDAWLGPCPWRPYNEEYVRGGWRGDYDFHTSCIGEWGAHTFAQAQMGLGLGETSPTKYHYVDNDNGDGMVCDFATARNWFSRGDKYWHGSCGGRNWAGRPRRTGSKSDVSSPELLAHRWRSRVPGPHGPRPHAQFLDCVKRARNPYNPGSCTTHVHGPRRQHLHARAT